MMEIRKGARFLHSRVLDTMLHDGKTPQLYIITSIVRGNVYYRPVYNYGTREELGSLAYCPVVAFPRIVKAAA